LNQLKKSMMNSAFTLLSAVDRDPNAIAIIDGQRIINYNNLLKMSSIVGSNLFSHGLHQGSHLVTLLQNNWQATIIYWACQLYGIIIVPLNWRTTSKELDYYLKDSEANIVIFQDISSDAVSSSINSKGILKISLNKSEDSAFIFESLLNENSINTDYIKDNNLISIMLYTSGTTGIGKGVPRSHFAERSAAIAHIAQNHYIYKENTLGVMPLYHTMGVRLLLSMCIMNGCFICQPKFGSNQALKLINKEKITSLYLVPTLYHDLISNKNFSTSLIKTVKKIGFAGSYMNQNLLEKLDYYFKPEVFINHYGSTEIYTFTYTENAQKKPGSAGKAGINQIIKVIDIDSVSSLDEVASFKEGKIIASMKSSEAFENYWKNPKANDNAIIDGWYITGDIGYIDDEGDLFITGRVDDMIISGGENILPIEIEDILSSYEDISEVVVCGLPDQRLGEIVTAFIKSNKEIETRLLDELFLKSDTAKFKRPRKYIFVDTIPKSPVGKVLRRQLKENYSK